uniref:Uncharacterized protein n=1 Tax=Brassica oleracea TaxID=3712 RepID=A0A3P6B2V7_BRAOL|nr:unnamed protein product [Brassica oleracea]
MFLQDQGSTHLCLLVQCWIHQTMCCILLQGFQQWLITSQVTSLSLLIIIKRWDTTTPVGLMIIMIIIKVGFCFHLGIK